MTNYIRAALLLFSACLVSSSKPAAAAPEIPGQASKQPIALIGATVHPVSGPAIEQGVLVIRRHKIVYVGSKAERIPPDARRVELPGKHIYPGLFDANSNMGLVEINSVRATRDQSETGDINPNVRAEVAVNPDSEIIPVTRSNGVLLSLTAPSGGLISGQSAVLQLDGWTFEELTLKAQVGMHLSWPRMAPVSDWWVEESAKQQIASREKSLKKLRETFEQARRYQTALRAAADRPRDIRWDALLPVLEGRIPLVVAADEVQQIQAAVAFARREKVKLIIYGGYDAEECAELLKSYDVPVIIGGVHRLPRRRSDEYDRPFTLAERLRQAGVPFCISGKGRFGASNVRNLPYHAAVAAAYGLPRDVALKSITLYPAQILGVADRVGSLAKGKDATLIVTDGDPLLTETQVSQAFIRGAEVDLSDRHKRLWKKYSERLRRQ